MRVAQERNGLLGAKVAKLALALTRVLEAAEVGNDQVAVHIGRGTFALYPLLVIRLL